MRQVPQYLIIGSGRVAQHFQHYFSLLQLNFDTWQRQESLAHLYQKVQTSTHILLLISDFAIEKFYLEHIKSKAICIHFSGSLVCKSIYGAHPLFSFNNSLYSLEQYCSIPFVVDHNAPDFQDLLPGLPNQFFRLSTSQKAKYHALCVLSGNFSCMLWQKLLTTLEEEFNIPSSVAFPYLRQQTQNLQDNFAHALTGPLVRKDMETLKKNLTALQSDPFQKVYDSFVSCYQKLQEESVT